MFDANEDRQTAYQQLVQALLNCPQNTEDRVLAANPDLVNEGLVKALRETAEAKIDPNDPSEAETIEWLFNFAEQLAQKLGGEKSGEEYQRFAIDLLQVVADSQGDSQVVHQFLGEHAIYLTEQLLAVLPHQVKTLLEQEEDLEWKFHIASTVGNLGNELQQLSYGNRSINLELAISCYSRALLVLTQADFPIEWATTENNRASAYSDRLQGSKSANLESAIAGYDRALLVLTQADFPIEYATTENNRASAYSDRIEGNRSANLEAAIAGYDRALLVLTQADYPTEWATTEANRAKAHTDALEEKLRQQVKLDENATVGKTISETLYPSSIQTPVDLPVEVPKEKLDLPVEIEISNPNEERQTAYTDLIQILLECPHGDEYRILAAHPDLVDEGLVMALVDTAEQKADRPDAETIATIQWLVDFAEQLAGKLGFEVGDVSEMEQEDGDYIEFSIDLLQTVANSEGYVNIVHQFLDERLDYLTPTLLVTFPKLIETLLEREEDPERQSHIISTLYNLSIDLSEFPRGDRSIVLQLSILCQERFLSVITQAAEIAQQQELKLSNSMPQDGGYANEADVPEHLDLHEKDYWNVFIELFQTVADSDGDGKLVHQFIDEHSNYFDAKLLDLFPGFIEKLFAQINNPETILQTAGWFESLAVDFNRYPRGNRSIVLGLGIICHEQALSARINCDESIEIEEPQINEIEIEDGDNWGFFVELFKVTLNSQGDEEIVHQFLDKYPTHLNPTFSALFPGFLNKLFAAFDDAETTAIIAAQFDSLAVDLIGFPRGDRSINIELAIACCERTLLEYNREKSPIEWAKAQANLATAYQNRLEGNRAKNLESAISGYEAALIVYDRTDFPIDFAMTQTNLENVRIERMESNSSSEHIQHQSADRESAIAWYDRVLTLYTQANFPIDWATTIENLAMLHTGKNDRLAIELYHQALEVFTPANFPLKALKTSHSLGQIYVNQGEWQLAIDAYEIAMKSVETSQTWIGTKQTQEDALYVYENAIQCAINLNNYPKAIEYTERSRSHQLVELDPTIAAQTAELKSIDFNSIQKLITTAHTAILTCYSTAQDTYIFIIKQSGEPTLHICKDRGWQKFQKWIENAWINPSDRDFSTWKQTLPRLLHNIAERLQLDTLIDRHLTDISELIIAPHINLHQIPFAALPVIGADYLLGDKFTIRTIPSCQTLQHPATSTQEIDAEESLLADILMGEHSAHPNEVFRATSENSIATITPINGFRYISPSSIQSTLWSVDDFVTAIFNHLYHQERQKGINRAISLQTAQLKLKNLTVAELRDIYYPKAIEYLTQHNPTLLPNLEAHVKAYCETEHPFNHPYYWAAFITKGLA